MIVGVFVITIFIGIFGFSFELITRVEGAMCLFLVLFFPVTMVVGVVVSFKEIFCEMGTPFVGAFIKSIGKRVKAIWKM